MARRRLDLENDARGPIPGAPSDGYHRLYDQLAVRLVGLLLYDREHIVRAEQPLPGNLRSDLQVLALDPLPLAPG